MPLIACAMKHGSIIVPLRDSAMPPAATRQLMRVEICLGLLDSPLIRSDENPQSTKLTLDKAIINAYCLSPTVSQRAHLFKKKKILYSHEHEVGCLVCVFQQKFFSPQKFHQNWVYIVVVSV